MTKPTFSWRGFVLAVALSVSTSFGSFLRANDLAISPATSATATESATEAEETSLDDILNLEINGSLRRTTRGEYIRVQLENTTDEKVQGPVYLVVKSTGIQGLEPGAPVLLLDADEKISGERKSRPRTVRFKAAERLTAAERAGLDLDYELVRELDTTTAKSEEQRTEDAATDTETDAELNAKYGLPADAKTFAGMSFGPKDLVRVAELKAAEEERLFAIEGVHGVGVAQTKGQLVVRVNIDRLGIAKQLPKFIKGVPVEYKVADRPTVDRPSRKATAQSGSVHLDTTRYRPLKMGVSISNFDRNIGSGTLGFFGRKNGEYYAVTNYHVIDNTFGSVGDSISQPSKFDGGVAADDVGELADTAPITLSSTASNELDAAIFKIKGGVSIDAATPEGDTINATPQFAFPGQLVRKYGRTTDETNGVVGITFYTTTINGYGNGNQSARFVNQIQIFDGNFSDPGDSGSLVYDSVTKRPVGLLFAGSSLNSVANPIGKVLDEFGLTVQTSDVTVPADTHEYFVRTWKDLNGNGIQDRGELNLTDMTVWMYDWTAQSWSSTIATNGVASFEVEDGKWYRFWVSPPSGYAHSPYKAGSNDATDSDFQTSHYSPWYLVDDSNHDVDAGFVPQTVERTYTVNTWRDVDGDGVRDTGDTDLNGITVWMYDYEVQQWSSKVSAAGKASFTVKETEQYVFWVNPPTGFEHGPTGTGKHNDFQTNHYSPAYVVSGDRSDIDAGLVPRAFKRTYTVNTWTDTDADGIRDANESGLDGIQMWIYDYSAAKWSSKVTSSGKAVFTVEEGKKYVFWAQPPNGMIHSPTGTGKTNDFATTHYSPQYTVAGNRSDIDAGFVPPRTDKYTIRVWNDTDGDGIQDKTEGGLDSVKVWVYDWTAQSWSSKVTNSSGVVTFDLEKNQWYRFWVSPPRGYQHSAANQGSNDSLDSDFGTNHYSPWYLVSGDRTDVDAGMKK